MSKRNEQLGPNSKKASSKSSADAARGKLSGKSSGKARSRQGTTPPSKFVSRDPHDPHASFASSASQADSDYDDIFGDDDAGTYGLATAGGSIAGGGSASCNEGLHAKVLVLNRGYAAMRVVSAKRAFVLLARNIAEVIHVDVAGSGADAEAGSGNEAIVGGQYINYDFASWAELSQLQAQLERDRHDWVRTVRYDIAVPRIIRLLGYDKLPEHGVKLNRRNLFARDRNRCQYCGRVFSTSDLSIDHVLPRAQGGKDSWENLVCSCIRCNARKGGRTPEQASMKLCKKPEKPRRNPLITLRLGHEKYSSWKAFLDHAYWSVELG